MSAARIIHAPLDCNLADELRGTVATVGNMDGVHLGHQALIRHTKALADGRPAAAIVFDPHPRRVFQPDAPPFMLTDNETKAELIGALGVDFLLVLPFVKALSSQTPETFVKVTLAERLGVKTIVTGTEFQFGKGRAGDAEALKVLAAEVGMDASLFAPVMQDAEEKISSSSIRQALREGRPQDAARLLGRPWAMRGTVIEGRRLARELGWPTANLTLDDYLRPQFGVYAVTAETAQGQFGGVANIGNRPTVDGIAERLEVHLFDFDDDLYGQTLKVSFEHFIRPEQKFDGLDALKAQIGKDEKEARTALG